jgi:RNA polymerase sigma factor (TIGR02999 family)
MRRVLVDYARKHRASKRYGRLERVDLGENSLGITTYQEVVQVDEALHHLAEAAPRVSEVVELIVFGGLTLAETAEALDVSARTVKRDWAFARAWLRHHMSDDGPTPAAA